MSFSLLVSEEQLDDGVRFELHLVHVGVLILQHLKPKTGRRTSETLVLSKTTSCLHIQPPALQNKLQSEAGSYVNVRERLFYSPAAWILTGFAEPEPEYPENQRKCS